MSETAFLLVLSVLLVAIIMVLLSFLSAVLWQLVKILREVYGIMRVMHAGSETLSEDLSQVRSKVIGGVNAASKTIVALRRQAAGKAPLGPGPDRG